ncbi:hypothetical protein [Streptomyces hesseae]|uniref:Uncharacterized protein n=1 Tax=Streptomyces hesseae TaxID=3075519 RepID=A0ABU2SM00_9ACTN|nr:hypothetical protein [Streptomyces sp. DSM 40473]MDT0450017.1 hypothetical protein [Streptomyces sp. DSM 40473]
MNTELRKRARRALDGPSGWAVSGETGTDGAVASGAGEPGEGVRSGAEAAAPAATGPAQQGE